ncbi:TetR/AcrR family transcriptional regulator [Glaciihabitans arcticus]|uniref:TetR/AcrR family transcriptional regulator n=1 Tax=Glaciihabitans arcticus TaxID=2668039 RepID=A0A4Q9GQ89_9MICO|nr:TetR/AcrR family transcriptional regulator [Glaciihabitans arcticus]TBN57016.1 TetR/AcrR family transcriptional regulator [Glaciihabitans arcticus]
MPRAGLTADRVTTEAAALVDEQGITALTLSTLAARLDVRAPSLYKHVASLDALRQSVAVRAKTEFGDALDAAAGESTGDVAVRAVAHAYREWARRHPGRYSLTLRAAYPNDPDDVVASTHAVRVMLRVVLPWQLSETEGIDFVRSLRSLLHGFVTLEEAGAFALPISLDGSFERGVDRLIGAYGPSV